MHRIGQVGPRSIFLLQAEATHYIIVASLIDQNEELVVYEKSMAGHGPQLVAGVRDWASSMRALSWS